ncbi:MAG: phospholipase D family protein [Candidatus Diapherotrites archaeon]|nr:phospholipase D family protein [Candidatus Diapherotrites archaeon]
MKKYLWFFLILLLLIFGLYIWPHSNTCKTEVYFCPEDNCEQVIAEAIGNAKEDVYVAMYSFTSQQIADKLIEAKERGIDVRVVLEEEQAQSKCSVYQKLVAAGIPIVLDKNENYMHNKFVVIDNKKVITGSANWSKNGMYRNDENIVVIDCQEIASKYTQEMEEIVMH